MSRNFGSILNFPKEGEHLLFSDEDQYDLEIKEVVLRKCFFERVGVKNIKAQSCVFQACIFQDCYFREGEFINVDFIGSVFKDCNLSKAKFKSCSFRYVRFNNCLINTQEILNSLPKEPNLRLQVLRSLKKNAMETGQNEQSDLFLIEEIKARKEELSTIAKSETSYYKDKYSFFARIEAVFQLLKLCLEGFIWGHGLSIFRLVRTSVLFMLLMGFISYKFKCMYYIPYSDKAITLNLFQSFYFSIMNFVIGG